MPPKKKAEAATAASPVTPAPAGYVSIRRVANGYILHTNAWGDDFDDGARVSYVFTNVDAAVAKATALLIPQPKAPKARKGGVAENAAQINAALNAALKAHSSKPKRPTA